MKKLGVLVLSVFSIILLLVGCKDNQKENPPTPVEPEVVYPRFSDISILESELKPGTIDVFVKALDEEAMIYLIVVPASSTAPTHEQIMKHEDYNSVSIVAYAQEKGTLYKTIEALDEGEGFDVYVTLSLNNTFAEKFYKTTCKTKTLEETIDKGSGTAEDPFKIFSIADLEQVAGDSETLSAYYSLENDIDLAEKYGPELLSFVPLSWQTGSLKAFSGSFNGNGHTIKNLYINETKESVGLFGQIGEEGVVSNLILENPVVATTAQRLGAAVGYNKGTVANISVLGGSITSLVPEGGQAKAGGIVGDMYESGSILRSISKTIVIAGGNNVGGICGSSDASTGKTKELEILDCYSLSDVKTSNKGKYVGGIVGYARCVKIERCYATGNIEGGEGVGGVVGFLQHRNQSPITPSVKSCFAMGVTLTVTGTSQSNNSGYVIGNRSTSNNTNPIYENLYYADSNLIGNQKTPQKLAEETDVAHFANKEWLKTNLNLDCNDIYWTMLTDAFRPTLVHASWDKGLYEAPLFITAINVSALNRNELSLHIEAKSGTISYVVVKKDAHAPTVDQILAHEKYDDVEILAFGTSTNPNLDDVISNLEDETEYMIYAVAKDGEKLSTISQIKGKTLAAPILLAAEYAVTNGDSIGKIILSVTSNKAVTTYYFVSKTQVSLTKEELMEKESTTNASVTITGLDENTLYYLYFYSKTQDEDVEIVEKSITTTADLVDLSLDVSLTTGITQGTLKLVITSNKDNTSIYYILGTPLDSYTIDQIKEGSLYEDEVVLSDLVDNTEYKIFVYGKTNTKQTEIITKTATTINPEVPLAVEIDVEANDDDFTYVLAITPNKEVNVYYLVSTSDEAPHKDALKALEATSSLSISLLELEHGTTYYVYVLCTTDKEETEVMTKEFVTASLPEVTLTAELVNTGLVKYAQADALFEVTDGATIHYLLSNEQLNKDTLTLTDLTETTTESKIEFRGLHSSKTYYLYACATKDEVQTPIVENSITTAEYKNFNRTYPKKSEINIYNAEDFYKFIEFANNGLPTNEEEAANGTKTKISASALVTLYGNIYLSTDQKVQMITDTFKGNFDGQGYTIYITDIYASGTVNGASTQSSVGGVIGVSEILVKNIVSDVTVVANGKTRTDSQIIGTIQNSSKETSIAKITSCISYKKGNLVRNWKNPGEHTNCYEVGTESSAENYQTTISLEDITEEWIKTNTSFDIEGTNDTLSLWVLDENQLKLRIGGLA
ncbi:MAG: hypothetical protein NC310_07325 [Roseburia sp.]|nr:hypothetical protein [Anaeroplasma bactoclasticum]MCM1196860.1 hypothetical protein [Roseburia sp.]